MRSYWRVVTRHRRATLNETLNNTVTQFAFHRKIMLLETWYFDRVSVNRIFFLNRAGCVVIAREWSLFPLFVFHDKFILSCTYIKNICCRIILRRLHTHVWTNTSSMIFSITQSKRNYFWNCKSLISLNYRLCTTFTRIFTFSVCICTRAYSYTVYGRRVSARSSQLEGLLKDVLSNSVAIKR